MSTFATLTTKKARTAYIREALGTDARWALRGLVRVFDNQTEDEQRSASVTADNGIGFTCIDSEFLTSLAKQYAERGTLSEKQMVHVFKKMPKYARQLEACIPVSDSKAVEAVQSQERYKDMNGAQIIEQQAKADIADGVLSQYTDVIARVSRKQAQLMVSNLSSEIDKMLIDGDTETQIESVATTAVVYYAIVHGQAQK